MLKLTNSFCRYFTVTCERLDYHKAHVRKIPHLSCRRERCSLDCADWEAKRQFHSTPSLRKHSKKGQAPINIPPLSSREFDQTVKMSESVQPTGNHVSYGGSFDVLSDEHQAAGNRQQGEARYASDGDQDIVLPPNFRYWENVVDLGGPRIGTKFGFKVVSYNMLAQCLLETHKYLYTDCLPKDLKWKVRAARLYEEIMSLDPDIICLQEVQATHLQNFYIKFEKSGYSSVFKQKTGPKHDGCAIYFKKSLFELQDHISVEYYQPDLAILNRDNIGVMVKLVPRGTASSIVIVTTHLLYNPKRTDIRLAQMQILLAEIDRFAFYSNYAGAGYLPIILTGDFNSLPESAVIKLLDKGKVSASSFRDDSNWERIGVMDNCQHLAVFLNRQHGLHTDFNHLKIFNSDYSFSSERSNYGRHMRTPFSEYFNSGQIGHQLDLVSVYNKYKHSGSYEASSFQGFWVTVDYMYFSVCRELCLKTRLTLPSALECSVLERLPNNVYASDHLLLAATFELTV